MNFFKISESVKSVQSVVPILLFGVTEVQATLRVFNHRWTQMDTDEVNLDC